MLQPPLSHTQRQRLTGFGSSDANRRAEFTHTLRTSQWKELLHKEREYSKLHAERAARIRAAAAGGDGTYEGNSEASDPLNSLTDRRDVIEELEEQYQRNLEAPHLFQTKVPSLYDIGRTPQGTTQFCNKCSKDTFYCVHRVKNNSVNARRQGPLKTTAQVFGSGSAPAVKPQYGLKGGIKEFLDRSHIGPGFD